VAGESVLVLGAGSGVSTEEGWVEAAGPVDLGLDSVGSTWRDSLRALRQGGRLAVFGATAAPR
jgi:NADPH:quinone reductase-like Zn-dependent oxidoreductase